MSDLGPDDDHWTSEDDLFEEREEYEINTYRDKPAADVLTADDWDERAIAREIERSKGLVYKYLKDVHNVEPIGRCFPFLLGDLVGLGVTAAYVGMKSKLYDVMNDIQESIE